MINSTAAALGPAIAGGLVQAVSAASVFVLTAALYLCSTISLKGASCPPVLPAANVGQSHFADIGVGVRLLWKNEIQRFIAIAAGAFNLFHTAFFTVFTFFALKQLEFSAAMFGTMVSVVGVFGLLGALCAPKLVEALGPRTTLVGSLLIIGPLGVPILLAEQLPFPYRAAVIAASIAAWDFAIVVHVIVEQTLRQTMIENRHLSRVTATVRFVSWGADPIGALLGGLAASSVLGARGTLLLCLIGFTASGALLLLSRGIRGLACIDPEPRREM
ncbi:MFS transporter [Paraburkholderia sp. SIMBA_030]|uniref:MFS transporter n=1 Tax=Paraburkholderia sp. SIMBA_030 TaxID=3085773 RepID=UPI00397C8C47